MFYIKTKISDGIELNIDLYEDEIFTNCPYCGETFEADTESLIFALQHGGFASNSILCKECTAKRMESE